MKLTPWIILLILCLPLGGCITRGEIDAAIWLNNGPVPADVCDREPALRKYGFYRKLDSGKKEFVSICNPLFRRFVSAHEDDFNRMLDKYLPKEP